MARRLLASVLSTFLLCGCSTEAQRRAQTMGANFKATLASMKQCSDSVNADARWEPLWQHASRDVGHPTIGQLADQSYALPAEIVLIEAHHDAISPCRTAALEQLESVDSRIANAFSQLSNDQDQITLAVAERKMAWGAANQARQQRWQIFREQLTGLEHQITGELDEDNAAELSRRAQVATAIAAGIGAAAQAARASQPIITTCSGGAGFASCVTRQ